MYHTTVRALARISRSTIVFTSILLEAKPHGVAGATGAQCSVVLSLPFQVLCSCLAAPYSGSEMPRDALPLLKFGPGYFQHD